MASERRNKSGSRKPRVWRKGQFDMLVAHRSFAPLIGLWGAALGGLAVLVLPPALIHALADGTLIGTFDIPVQASLAGGLAVVLGGAFFALAAVRSAAVRHRLHPASIISLVNRRVRPIDPLRDLGTRSLDDPIETMPFASPERHGAGVGKTQAQPEAHGEPAPAPEVVSSERAESAPPAPSSASQEQPPLALDLAAFAELPGRNAVWVEAPASPVPASASAPLREVPAAMPRRAAAPPPAPGTAALARLRATPASELSMVEMVERFAGALHEHRASRPVRALAADELAAREAALAEALKALSALSGASAASASDDAEEPLRAALSRLQPQRGAARAH